MLIKFFPNGKGSGAGPVNYLTARTVLAYDENRDLIRDANGQPKHVTRDPLPEVLRDDAAIMTDLIDACPHKWSYCAGVISFAEGGGLGRRAYHQSVRPRQIMQAQQNAPVNSPTFSQIGDHSQLRSTDGAAARLTSIAERSKRLRHIK